MWKAEVIVLMMMVVHASMFLWLIKTNNYHMFTGILRAKLVIYSTLIMPSISVYSMEMNHKSCSSTLNLL